LQRNMEPNDIDICCAWTPENIWSKAKKDGIHAFITEKYWTMTFIPQSKEKQYEVTPFRTESWYSDSRRPDTITRSSSLLLDAQRRDFTINALYYTYIRLEKTTKNQAKSIYDDQSLLAWDLVLDIEAFEASIKKQWWYAIADIIIIQDTDLITTIWPEWQIDLAEWKQTFWLRTHTHCIVDPYKWIQDIRYWKLRCVWLADKRLHEDALRVIRAIRFVNTLNTATYSIDFEKETWSALKKNFFRIRTLPKERIHIELMKILEGGSPFWFLALCDELNILKTLFPSIHATKWIDQPVRYHPFDVYNHTLLCVHAVEQITSNPYARIAMMYHDVGKVDQYYLYSLDLDKKEINRLGELNHRQSSAVIAKPELKALWFGSKAIEEICWYINNHHKPEEILSANIENQKKKLRKMYSDVWYAMMQNLFDVVLADRIWQFNPIQKNSIWEVTYLRSMLDTLRDEEGQFEKKNLCIDGKILLENYNLQQWPVVWDILQSAFDRVLEDIQRNNIEQLHMFVRWYLHQKWIT